MCFDRRGIRKNLKSFSHEVNSVHLTFLPGGFYSRFQLEIIKCFLFLLFSEYQYIVAKTRCFLMNYLGHFLRILSPKFTKIDDLTFACELLICHKLLEKHRNLFLLWNVNRRLWFLKYKSIVFTRRRSLKILL